MTPQHPDTPHPGLARTKRANALDLLPLAVKKTRTGGGSSNARLGTGRPPLGFRARRFLIAGKRAGGPAPCR